MILHTNDLSTGGMRGSYFSMLSTSLSYHLIFIFVLFLKVAPDVKEVLDTFRVAAELGSDSLGAYVISMAANV